MPEDDYGELVEQVRENWDEEESAGPMPPDDETFDSDRLPGYDDGDYPDWLQACADTRRNITDDLKRIRLAQLLSPNGTVWQVTEPPPNALKRLKSLKIQKPPPILHLA